MKKIFTIIALFFAAGARAQDSTEVKYSEWVSVPFPQAAPKPARTTARVRKPSPSRTQQHKAPVTKKPESFDRTNEKVNRFRKSGQ